MSVLNVLSLSSGSLMLCIWTLKMFTFYSFSFTKIPPQPLLIRVQAALQAQLEEEDKKIEEQIREKVSTYLIS